MAVLEKSYQFKRNQFSMSFSPMWQKRNIYLYSKEPIPKDFYPKANSLLKHTLFRQQMNMNVFILVVGAVRSSKSYFALKFAEQFCKLKGIEFDVNKQVSFDVKPFLIWSQTAMDNIFVLDEVGVNLNPQEWYSVQSKIMRNFTQTQGFRRNVLILVLPNVAFLLKSIRFMCNYVCETVKQGVVRVRKIYTNHTMGKSYPLFMGILKFKLPSKKTVKDYEEMKKEWNDKHLKMDLDFLEQIEEDKTDFYKQKMIEMKYELMQHRLAKIKKEKTKSNNFLSSRQIMGI